MRRHLDPFSQGSWAVWAPGRIARHFAALHEPAGGCVNRGGKTAPVAATLFAVSPADVLPVLPVFGRDDR